MIYNAVMKNFIKKDEKITFKVVFKLFLALLSSFIWSWFSINVWHSWQYLIHTKKEYHAQTNRDCNTKIHTLSMPLFTYFSMETKFSRSRFIVFWDEVSDSSPACACSTCSQQNMKRKCRAQGDAHSNGTDIICLLLLQYMTCDDASLSMY